MMEFILIIVVPVVAITLAIKIAKVVFKLAIFGGVAVFLYVFVLPWMQRVLGVG
jgi:hypothetical protein